MKQDSITSIQNLSGIRLKLASPKDILAWSYGEVAKAETINYRTQRPEKDGLFDERIFGPEKDWECYCGKYRRIRYKGIVCDKCGVEVTRAIVRRERMGHIKLAVPVAHIWFLRGVPSKFGLLFDKTLQELERVVYFASYVVISVDEEAKLKAFEEVSTEYKAKLAHIKKDKEMKKMEKARKVEDLNRLFEKSKKDLLSLKEMHIIDEPHFRDLSLKYGEVFEAGTGAEALRKILQNIDLFALRNDLQKDLSKTDSQALQRKIIKRLKLTESLLKAGIRPEWMCLTVIPVIPPDLRPMVQLDGGRYATSDVNDLYRRVINRNNRLKRLLELNAPEVIVRNEKRMLQEAVDALIDNSARKTQGQVVAPKRELRSLADLLKGKQGRFRQNLLGKRVDYSGRSVIVVGPELKISQCGLPKIMALEIFKPFVIKELIARGLAHNVRGAGKLIEDQFEGIWDILEDVTRERLVLLNRAPTLHRLGIQAFNPILIEGRAIQVHPLACEAFNADFDGDQMAVHLPLSKEAQREAKDIMLSSQNLLKPATGELIANPSKNIVLGLYWMTRLEEKAKGEGSIFGSSIEAVQHYEYGNVDLRARIKIRTMPGQYTETTAGRILFNEVLPADFSFINREVDKKYVRSILLKIIDKYGAQVAAVILDKIKDLGFDFATKSGISWGMDDLNVPKEKEKLVDAALKEEDIVRLQYEQGLLTEEERRSKIIEIWERTKIAIAKLVPESLDKQGSVYHMISSGARGSWGQTTQMSGMKGLVVDPSSRIIELPVISSYKEGFDVLEYFISTHGARKGSIDTALRTATAGYLTRRLVDVCQDLVIREENCKTSNGIYIYKEDSDIVGHSLDERIWGRIAAEDIRASSGILLVRKGEIISKDIAWEIEEAGIEKVKIRSVATCESLSGLCQKCYGFDLGRNKLVELGEPVGVVTAQSIGEPGTQLTMRTFHAGGVAGGGDITLGLPRVEEIFEARTPRKKASIAQEDGEVVDIGQGDKTNIVRVKIQNGTNFEKSRLKIKKSKIREYQISQNYPLWVQIGDKIKKGQQLCEGKLDLKELHEVAGTEELVRYTVKEVQMIYSSEGANINDKYIEVVARQMMSRVYVSDPGSTDLLPGGIYERGIFEKANAKAKFDGGKQAKGKVLLMGVTKVSLSTDSFLSAASFQETARSLIGAAVEGKIDRLRGLKENVIIGRLVPAGTGFKRG